MGVGIGWPKFSARSRQEGLGWPSVERPLVDDEGELDENVLAGAAGSAGAAVQSGAGLSDAGPRPEQTDAHLEVEAVEAVESVVAVEPVEPAATASSSSVDVPTAVGEEPPRGMPVTNEDVGVEVDEGVVAIADLEGADVEGAGTPTDLVATVSRARSTPQGSLDEFVSMAVEPDAVPVLTWEDDAEVYAGSPGTVNVDAATAMAQRRDTLQVSQVSLSPGWAPIGSSA